jgi:signal transduction histidine kinase/ligand-binding sensor domain-containing protein
MSPHAKQQIYYATQLYCKPVRVCYAIFIKQVPFLFLIFLHFFCTSAWSQKQQVKFERIHNNAGLAESNILCVLQDSRGFMWFGTAHGLYKYDGYTFTLYKNEKTDPLSISNNFIQSLAESRNGDLWIATSGGGICRYDRRKDQFIRFQNDPGNANTLATDDVNTVLEDSKGQLWAGTLNGLDRYDSANNKFIHYTHDSTDSTSIGDNYIRYIYEDSGRDLWIGTLKGGLNLFNRPGETFTRFQHSAQDSKTISSNDIFTIFEDSKKRLWIGTNESGLDVFSRKKNEFTHFTNKATDKNSLSSNAIRSIGESNDHIIWIGTENSGINIFDPKNGLFHTYASNEFDNASPSSNSINTIYKDAKGNMWIGTFNGGINFVNIDAAKFTHYRHIATQNSLSDNKVLCIYEDSKKNIWIGTDGGGLNLFDPQTGRFTYFRHDKNNKNSICGDYVLSVCEDSKGNIWIGAWGDGVSVFNRKANSFKHYKSNLDDPHSLSNNNAWKIFEDSDKNIWIGTYGGGLNRFNPSTQSFISYQFTEDDTNGISDNWINNIYEDSDANLWICTSGGGLNLFNKKTQTFTRFQPQAGVNSISHGNTNAIYEDRNKNLWIATMSGLNCLNRNTNKFSVYTTNDGLPGNIIYGILEGEKNKLWISTDNGLSCFDPIAKTFTNYSTADGLQSNKFKEQAFCKSSTGVMYFGGNNGFNQFVPRNIKTVAYDPPLVLTNFLMFNKEVPVAGNENDPLSLKQHITETKSIVLSYRNSFFSFAFASLNYSATQKKKYAYMLEGFDEAWNEVGTQHTATYTNLDPGKYVFKVKGLNNEGEWSPSITTIQLTITPPFWFTWWFRITVLLFFAGAAISFYLVRINAVKKQRMILEQKVTEQTAQLVTLNEEERKARHEADQANIELEKKNNELEQFVYIASHDLREPLRTTSSFVDLFQKQYKGKLDAKADTYLTYIAQASERMATLINDLLDYSRLGTNKELKQVDCNTILQEVLTDLGVALTETNATITYSSLPVINGHPTAMKQLFQNLLANGIKFRKKEVAPAINVSAKEQDGSWRISVTDNGIGIQKQHSDKIFAIFQRLHTRKEYEGTGIGLAHCKKIVELHKGTIWVESEPGEGSTFHFTIPCTDV